MSDILTHLIQSIRHQMHALDQTLSLLEKQIGTAGTEESAEPKCPSCGNDLPVECQYSAMGTGVCYACPNCDFRGAPVR